MNKKINQTPLLKTILNVRQLRHLQLKMSNDMLSSGLEKTILVGYVNIRMKKYENKQ